MQDELKVMNIENAMLRIDIPTDDAPRKSILYALIRRDFKPELCLDRDDLKSPNIPYHFSHKDNMWLPVDNRNLIFKSVFGSDTLEYRAFDEIMLEAFKIYHRDGYSFNPLYNK